MKKLFLITILASSVFASCKKASETKQQKIKQLTELELIIPDSEATYGKFLSEEDLDVTIKFYTSSSGKRLQEFTKESAAEMGALSQQVIMSVIQDLIAPTEKVFDTTKTAATVKIDAEAKTAKAEKIEQLLTFFAGDTQLFNNMLQPMFTQLNITKKETQEEAINKIADDLKQCSIPFYDKFFSEENIDEILNFYSSDAGKRFKEAGAQAIAEFMQAHKQAMADAEEQAAKAVPSTAVIHFQDTVKSKDDDEIRELFNKEIKHEGVTIVKFSASWCGPCKIYAPVFNDVAQELKSVSVDGKIVPVKYLAIDTEAVSAIAQDYSIRSIPTTIFFKNGKKVKSQNGSIKNKDLKNFIEEVAKS